MPELPEVETVKRELEQYLVNKTFQKVNLLYPNLVKTDKEEFINNLVGLKILSLGRKGKFLLFNLSGDYTLITHFRMEGKYFYTDKLDAILNKYVTCYFTFSDNTYLVFQDVRKFGVMYLYKNNELDKSPLAELGKEVWDITSYKYLLDKFKNNSTMLKEELLNQKVIAGFGNIYADEVCYKSRLNPFMEVKNIKKEEASKIISNGREILDLAIKHKGSTIKTFEFANHKKGDMQSFLKVYGKKGKPCPICHNKFEKRFVSGRGTTYCYKCQKVFPSIAITGEIASGKTFVLNLLKERGYYTISSDNIVHELYLNQAFLKELKNKFSFVFTNDLLDKKKVMTKMLEDKKFRRSYQLFIWSKVKDRINDFIIHHTDNYQFIEVPLLFEAKMENDFSFILGVETKKQVEYLKIRNDDNISSRLKMASINSYSKNKDKLDFVIVNNNSKEDLENKLDQIILDLNRKFKQ